MNSVKAVLGLFLIQASLLYAQELPFVHAVGNRLELGDTGEQVFLRGMGMGNFVNEGVTDPGTLFLHHDSTDFRKLADAGMTAVRFNLRCDAFETAPYVYNEETFDWLRVNTRWAANCGLYLIPVTMAVPGSVPGDASGFWDDRENQQRLKALWVEIAERFAGESAIAAYDILNEPIPSSPDQWQQLAQEIIDTIRTVDANHMILLEPLYGVNGEWQGDYDNPDDVQFLVNDSNILYDFHFYRPKEYTHWYQYGPSKPNWPDGRLIHLPPGAAWITGTSSNPSPPAGTTPWSWYEGNSFLVDDPAIAFGMIRLQTGGNEGTVWFDDVRVTRHGIGGEPLDTLFEDDITSTDDWLYAYASYGAQMTACDSTGNSDAYSLAVSDASEYGGWASRASRFPVEQGSIYRASGAMRADSLTEGGFAIIRLDFYSDPGSVGLLPWDPTLLELELDRWTEFGETNNLPMNVGEFGVDGDLFDGHGGVQWVEAMLDKMIKKELNFTYHLWDLVRFRDELFEVFADALCGAGSNREPGVVFPRTFQLSLYPNPVNDQAVVSFQLTRSRTVTLELFNRLGRRVVVIGPEVHSPGVSQSRLNLKGMTSGLYFLRASEGSEVMAVKRMVLLK